MNKSANELLQLVRKLVPPLSPGFYKGQAGRIVVIGGCEDYTGAPYFSAHAAAVFGADLSHVVCEKQAAAVIKSYSPNLMVHPYLYESDNVPVGEDANNWVDTKVLPKVHGLLDRIHVVVLGPGLGRDELMLSTVEKIIAYLREKNTAVVLDADALFLICQKPEIIQGYDRAVLTPNIVEFKRLAKALGVEHDDLEEETRLVAKKLGVTVMRKGSEDVIVNGDILIKSSLQGSNRRAGGQGDTLTGNIATLLAWGDAYSQGLWSHPQGEITKNQIPVLACFGASCVTRYAARLAFNQVGRAMQATDLHAKVGEAYKAVIEDQSFSIPDKSSTKI